MAGTPLFADQVLSSDETPSDPFTQLYDDFERVAVTTDEYGVLRVEPQDMQARSSCWKVY